MVLHLLHRISANNDAGKALLTWAIQRGHEAIGQLLLDYDVEVGSRDADDSTPLLQTVTGRDCFSSEDSFDDEGRRGTIFPGGFAQARTCPKRKMARIRREKELGCQLRKAPRSK